MTEQAYRYIAIDLKSFYASVECVDRGLNPLTTRLVVADQSRSSKTICLAVSPAMKKLGIPGRPRLFEVEQKAKGIDYIVALPRMARYMEVSTYIYRIYLKYIAPEDIHVYSVDEVFIDVTAYRRTYQKTAREIAQMLIGAVYRATGITATVGLGTNLYLCKVAMDIIAKQMEADETGARIAGLDEMAYRRLLWEHRPLTDFWRIGSGYSRRLAGVGLYTMGDIARCSLGDANDFYQEDLLYRLFGINAELLIDHAWGWEPCRLSDIKAYRPQRHSLSSGQVLTEPYSFEQARIVVREMMEGLSLDLTAKQLVTNRVTLTVGYDIENLLDPDRAARYQGKIHIDRYGRQVPQHAQGTQTLAQQTALAGLLTKATDELFVRIVDPTLLIRRLTLAVCDVERGTEETAIRGRQLNLLTDYAWLEDVGRNHRNRQRERQLQEAVLQIRKRHGKNAILKGYSLLEGATAKQRNAQIGGHRA